MPSFPVSGVLIAAIAAGISLLVTPVVRSVARAKGAVAQPKNDRWHSRPTAMFGGVSLYVATIVSLVLFAPLSAGGWVVLAASSVLFTVGIVDDLFNIKPYQKLIGQLVGAAIIVYAGLLLPWTAFASINTILTVFWLVGITNAVNMLDNMDGLSAGVVAIAATFLALHFARNGEPGAALMLAGFAGALLGFLAFNHNPASIFMGDCGSLFIGFFLASTALLGRTAGGRSRSLLAVLAVPVLVLCVPIFDTTFVTLMRKLAGRAASQGGRDHTSHRLVALGVTEKHAVWLLYALAFSSGALALIVGNLALDVSVAAIAAFIILLTLLGIHLGRVRVYADHEIAAAREKPLVALLLHLSHKRRIFEVLLDVALITMSYYLAYALMFGPYDGGGDWQLFTKTLPIVIIVKLLTFLATGIYRGIWRYASVSTVFQFVRAVMLSSIAFVMVIVVAFRFAGYSRSVIGLDAALLFGSVVASRFTFRVMRSLLPSPHARDGRRVIIFGAGDAGELLLRELETNGALKCVPVAFVDDDAAKAGRFIHGLRVHHGSVALGQLCKRLRVEEVLISTSRLSAERLAEILAECVENGIGLVRAGMTFQKLTPAELGWVVPQAPAFPLTLSMGDGDPRRILARTDVTGH